MMPMLQQAKMSKMSKFCQLMSALLFFSITTVLANPVDWVGVDAGMSLNHYTEADLLNSTISTVGHISTDNLTGRVFFGRSLGKELSVNLGLQYIPISTHSLYTKPTASEELGPFHLKFKEYLTDITLQWKLRTNKPRFFPHFDVGAVWVHRSHANKVIEQSIGDPVEISASLDRNVIVPVVAVGVDYALNRQVSIGGVVRHVIGRGDLPNHELVALRLTYHFPVRVMTAKPEAIIYFAHNKAVLTPQAQNKLTHLPKQIAHKKIEKKSLLLAGYASRPGKMAYNQRLSLQRAKAVKMFLIRHGLMAENIRLQGLGAAHPVADNGTAKGQSLNRRVEIWFKEQAR